MNGVRGVQSVVDVEGVVDGAELEVSLEEVEVSLVEEGVDTPDLPLSVL